MHTCMQGLLDVLVHVVRGCAVEQANGVPAAFIQQIFPNAVKKILNSTDSAVLQVKFSIDGSMYLPKFW